MKTGLRWVVGDGKSIRIFSDRWLRGKENFCVDQGVSSMNGGNVRVCDFFMRGRKEWDVTKVRNTFNSIDAEAILAVRIPQNNTSDRIAWVHSNNGQYSVKSAYHDWHSRHMGDVALQHSDGWGNIWRLGIPHKIKVLLWRICHNNVPVRNLLRGKGIRVPITCVMCVGDVEHLMHLFLDCEFTKLCWQRMGLTYDTREVESAPEWLLDKLNTESSDNLLKIATVIWGVWWARNQRVWEGKVISPQFAMEWSSKQIGEWREVQKRKHCIHNQVQGPVLKYNSKWVAPVNGTLKVNVDASVYQGADSFSIGMVMRNHQGLFVRGKTRRLAGRVTVLEAELVGILEALVWSTEFQGQTIVVESDSLLSVQAINKAKTNQLEAGDLIIAQCRAILSSNVKVSVVFVNKQANMVAHSLARLPCTLNSFIDLLSPPLCVLETLLSDGMN